MMLSEEQFNEFVRNIDSTLSQKLTQIPYRPINAVIEAYERLNINGEILGPETVDVSYPVSERNLSAHIINWYENTYGDALKIDLSEGKFPVLIQGTVYSCKLPLLLGSGRLIVSKTKHDNNQLMNVVDFIDKLPDYVRSNLTGRDERILEAAFVTVFTANNIISACEKDPLIASAVSDAYISCDQLVGCSASYAHSSWHSLQFAEKIIKYFISQFEEPKFIHEIKKLKNKAVTLGYVPDSRIQWDLLDFKPAIRYDPGSVDIKQALAANQEAWRIAFDVMHQLKA